MENLHQETSSVKIYWTSDYGKFHFLHGNRDINETKVKKLIKDVENGLDLFKFCPILVNETMHIIDGQHRFFVCKKLKLNIYYTIVPDFSLAEIAKMNNNQNRWKMVDFLNCYIDAGKNKEDYKTLLEFKNKYKLNISLAASLLLSGKPRHNGENLEKFRNGTFQVKFLDEATALMDWAFDYSEFSDVVSDRYFISALKTLLENGKFSHTSMLKKLKTHELRIDKRNSPKDYLVHMEELFNFKNSKRQTIY